jgi:hypothetical protein
MLRSNSRRFLVGAQARQHLRKALGIVPCLLTHQLEKEG